MLMLPLRVKFVSVMGDAEATTGGAFLFLLGPRLCLGPHCPRGSASPHLHLPANPAKEEEQAEPARPCVPRLCLGTRRRSKSWPSATTYRGRPSCWRSHRRTRASDRHEQRLQAF